MNNISLADITDDEKFLGKYQGLMDSFEYKNAFGLVEKYLSKISSVITREREESVINFED